MFYWSSEENTDDDDDDDDEVDDTLDDIDTYEILPLTRTFSSSPWMLTLNVGLLPRPDPGDTGDPGDQGPPGPRWIVSDVRLVDVVDDADRVCPRLHDPSPSSSAGTPADDPDVRIICSTAEISDKLSSISLSNTSFRGGDGVLPIGNTLLFFFFFFFFPSSSSSLPSSPSPSPSPSPSSPSSPS